MSFEFFIDSLDLSPYLVSGYEVHRGLCLHFERVPKETFKDVAVINQRMISYKRCPAIFHSADGLVSTWKPFKVRVLWEGADFDPTSTIEYQSSNGRLLIRLDER